MASSKRKRSLSPSTETEEGESSGDSVSVPVKGSEAETINRNLIRIFEVALQADIEVDLVSVIPTDYQGRLAKAKANALKPTIATPPPVKRSPAEDEARRENLSLTPESEASSTHTPVRCTFMTCTHMRYTIIKCTPMRHPPSLLWWLPGPNGGRFEFQNTSFCAGCEMVPIALRNSGQSVTQNLGDLRRFPWLETLLLFVFCLCSDAAVSSCLRWRSRPRGLSWSRQSLRRLPGSRKTRT